MQTPYKYKKNILRLNEFMFRHAQQPETHLLSITDSKRVMHTSFHKLAKNQYKSNSFLIRVLFVFIGFVLSVYLTAQNVGINATGAAPNSSAMLDVSSASKVLLIPRITDAQRKILKDPAAGLIIYNTDTDELNLYNGTGWQRITESSVSSPSGTVTAGGQGVAINTTGALPDPTAMLDIAATDKGLLIPRTTPGSVTAVTGLIIYNTSANAISYYNGTQWLTL